MKFKVKIAYEEDEASFFTVDEVELEKVIRAQVTGKVALLDSGTVGGNHIISIRPDFDSMPAKYNPNGPDFISPRVIAEHELAIRNVNERVKAQLQGRPVPEPMTLPENFRTGIKSLGEAMSVRIV